VYGDPSPPDGVTERVADSPGRGGSGDTAIVPDTPGPTLTVFESLTVVPHEVTSTETV